MAANHASQQWSWHCLSFLGGSGAQLCPSPLHQILTRVYKMTKTSNEPPIQQGITGCDRMLYCFICLSALGHQRKLMNVIQPWGLGTLKTTQNVLKQQEVVVGR